MSFKVGDYVKTIKDYSGKTNFLSPLIGQITEIITTDVADKNVVTVVKIKRLNPLVTQFDTLEPTLGTGWLHKITKEQASVDLL